MPSFADIWRTAKKIDSLLELEERQNKSLAVLADRLTAIERRMDRLEAREEIVVAKAEGAARSAAAIVGTASVADLSRRIGILEERAATGAAATPKKRLKRDP